MTLFYGFILGMIFVKLVDWLFDKARSVPQESPPTPPPIERGSVWLFSGENPFQEPWDVVVLETREGWVRYSMGKDYREWSLPERSFRSCYKPVPCITETLSTFSSEK